MFAQYRKGSGVDSIAGAEALISHIITQKLNIPCAHAPAFSPVEAGKVKSECSALTMYQSFVHIFHKIDESVSPKACAEELGYTFLPCILAYLHRAPELIPLFHDQDPSFGDDMRSSSHFAAQLRVAFGSHVLTADNVDAVVVPVRFVSF